MMFHNQRGYAYQVKTKMEDSFHATISPTEWKDFSYEFNVVLFMGVFGLLFSWYLKSPILGLLVLAIYVPKLTLLFLQYKRTWHTIEVDGDELITSTQSVVGAVRKKSFRLKDIEAVVHEPRFVAIYIKVRGKRWIRGLATYNVPPREKKLLAEELAGYLGVPLMRKGIWSTRFYPLELEKHGKDV